MNELINDCITYWPIFLLSLLSILPYSLLFLIPIIGSKVTFHIASEDNNVIDQHQYTEEEFITLFNYCLCKREVVATKILNNSAFNMYYQKVCKIDQLMEPLRAQHGDPYNDPDYNKMSKELLRLLTRKERRQINYGILVRKD